jgi:hypothetical protein
MADLDALVFTIIVGTEYIREQSDIGGREGVAILSRDITEMMKIGTTSTRPQNLQSKAYNRTFDRLARAR